MPPQKSLEDIVFEHGLTDILRLERAMRESANRHVLLAATLIDLGYVEQRALASLLALATGYKLVDPLPEDEAERLRGRLPAALAREAMAVPVALDGDVLTVAMLDPTLDGAIATLASTSGLKVVPAVGVRTPLETLVDRLYPEYQGDDITLMSGLRLSLDNGESTAGAESGQETENDRPGDYGTVILTSTDQDGEDTTAPRGSGHRRPIEIRVETLESRLVDVVRILADVQARLDAIEARLRRLPNS